MPDDLKGAVTRLTTVTDYLATGPDFRDIRTLLAHISRIQEENVWKADGSTPGLPMGREGYFIVAVRRSHNGKVYSFPALYLNNFRLQYEDEDDRLTTGWFGIEANEDGDGVTYNSILGDGDELVAWRACPRFASQEQGGPEHG